MSTLISKQNDVIIAMPGKRLDTSTAPETETDLFAEIEAEGSRLVIDFSETSYISSAGLRVLLKMAKALKQKNGSLALCNANEQIHEVLEISGFLGMLTYCADLAEAVATVSA